MTLVRTCFDKSKVCVLTTMPLQWFQKCCFNKDVSWCIKQTHSPVTARSIYYYEPAGSSAKVDSLENNLWSYHPHNWIYQNCKNWISSAGLDLPFYSKNASIMDTDGWSQMVSTLEGLRLVTELATTENLAWSFHSPTLLPLLKYDCIIMYFL